MGLKVKKCTNKDGEQQTMEWDTHGDMEREQYLESKEGVGVGK